MIEIVSIMLSVALVAVVAGAITAAAAAFIVRELSKWNVKRKGVEKWLNNES